MGNTTFVKTRVALTLLKLWIVWSHIISNLHFAVLVKLTQITIPVVTLEEQKKIGKIYIERIKLQSKLNKYSDLIEQFTNSIIEEALKGDD